MKIGNQAFKHGIALAPLAGYSNSAMRSLSYRAGAEYSVTEMVSAKAITYSDKKTVSLAKIGESEGPVALQLFGSEPDVMARAAQMILRQLSEIGSSMPFAVDINMGCPVKKIFSNGEGSALMKSPELIYKIVKAVSLACDLPVTVKLRAGIDKNSINAPECAMAAEAGGAKLITVHGRTREQMYGGIADREVIKNVKKSVHIPVIANGDVKSGSDALSMLADTGADGIAVGRAAVGNPFIFSEITAMLEGREYTEPTLDMRREYAIEHIRLAVLDKGERVAVPESRGAIASYFTSFQGAAAIRADINRAQTMDEVISVIKRI